MTIKKLEEHQKDIESIVERKGGKILDSKWNYYGKQKICEFLIECDKGHKWWVSKSHLLPSINLPDGSWCPDPDCRGKSLKEHQKDIETIVKSKSGKILESKWRYTGKKKDRKTASFYIECENGHRWWVLKNSLLPSEALPNGSWCFECINKTLKEHQIDIEPIIESKGGKILGGKWKYIGKNNHKTPYFHIKCDKGHDWWASKTTLVPNKANLKGSWCKICQDRIGAIGIFAHILLEYYSLKYINLKKCNARHEDSIEEGGQPDLVIERNSKFRTNIELFQNIVSFSENIEFVLVDFTMALSPKVIIEKCFRGYQAENRFLIIVLLREEGELKVQYFRNLLDNDINIYKNYRKNIKIINFNEYLSFLNLDSYLKLIGLDGQLDILNFNKWNSRPQDEKEIVAMFLKTINLSIKAIDDDSALNKLKQLSKKYSKLL